MYQWRKMSAQERREIVDARRSVEWPLHAPPHFANGKQMYLLTGSCYEHRPYMFSEARRDEWLAILTSVSGDLNATVRAWVVLPNHYHLLAEVELEKFGRWVGRKHNGTSTQWNREDGTPGRKVWFRFTDRRIRSDRHYFAALNYIHSNPVKHGYVARSREWEWSSLHYYLRDVGEEQLRVWWRNYPVGDMGRGWDD